MEKRIILSDNEKETIKLLHGIISEEDSGRVISRYQLNKNDWRRYKSEGLIPYMLNTSVGGNYKLIEIKEPQSKSIEQDPNVDRIFLIRTDQLPIINRAVKSINNLTLSYQKIIDLYRQQLIGIIQNVVKR